MDYSGQVPRTSTSNFTHLLNSDQLHSSSSNLLYVNRDGTDYQVLGAQDSHVDFHTDPEL